MNVETAHAGSSTYVSVHEKTRYKSEIAILDNAHLKVQTLCYFMLKSDWPNGDKITSVWDNAILFSAFFSSLFILIRSAGPALFDGCGTFFQCQHCAARPTHSLQHGDHARSSVITSCNLDNTGLAPRDEDQERREEGWCESQEQTGEIQTLPTHRDFGYCTDFE